jgi:AcrR family transcriptional regulator
MASSKRSHRKRRYDAEDTRRRILAAAQSEFAAYGFHGARVDRIARKAQANKAMIYQYFENKEGLYRTVFLENYARLSEERQLLELSEEDIPHLTERILLSYFEFHDRNPEYWRFIAWENLTPGTGIEIEDLHEISGEVLDHLEQLYHQGQAEGIFRMAVSFASYIFTLMAVSFFYRSNMATLRGTLPEEVSTRADRTALASQLAQLVDGGARGENAPVETHASSA